IEGTHLWNEAGNEQEMTFYRCLSSYLDTLFLKMGETGCLSKQNTDRNQPPTFPRNRPSPTYSRNIDLILQYNDSQNIDLCSNEWKRSKVTPDLELKQQ
ncbi:uncharacterized protein EV154DRAFT_414375, partial [Mucor mucedo]|uniref:uncharacterized protein n=1 Tax=Mucor mucedo TaxID=29922 RepID=UPI00221EF861